MYVYADNVFITAIVQADLHNVTNNLISWASENDFIINEGPTEINDFSDRRKDHRRQRQLLQGMKIKNSFQLQVQGHYST